MKHRYIQNGKNEATTLPLFSDDVVILIFITSIHIRIIHNSQKLEAAHCQQMNE
jgi:hypothetical protein